MRICENLVDFYLQSFACGVPVRLYYFCTFFRTIVFRKQLFSIFFSNIRLFLVITEEFGKRANLICADMRKFDSFRAPIDNYFRPFKFYYENIRMYRKKIYYLGASSYRRVLFFGLVARRFIVPAGIDSNENKERSFRASSQLCSQFGAVHLHTRSKFPFRVFGPR